MAQHRLIPKPRKLSYSSSYKDSYWQQASGPPINEGPFMRSMNAQSAEGYNVEGYHLLKKKGGLIPHTPWLQFENRFSTSGTYWWKSSSGYYQGWRPSVFDVEDMRLTEVSVKQIANSYDVYQLTQAAAAKIYETGFDALTFIAEFKSVIRLFTRLRARLISLAQGDIANSWLEARYGWRILYYDIVDFAETLSNLDSSRKRFAERVGFNDTYVKSKSLWYGSSSSSWTAEVFADTTADVSARGSVIADIEPPKFRFNVAITAWELISYSFIVDWFIKVGTWLAALSFIALQTAYTAAGGILISAQRSTYVKIYSNPGNVTSDLSSSASSQFVWRIPHSLSLIPRLSVSLSVPKVLDLWALLSGGKSPRR